MWTELILMICAHWSRESEEKETGVPLNKRCHSPPRHHRRVWRHEFVPSRSHIIMSKIGKFKNNWEQGLHPFLLHPYSSIASLSSSKDFILYSFQQLEIRPKTWESILFRMALEDQIYHYQGRSQCNDKSAWMRPCFRQIICNAYLPMDFHK